MHVQNQNKTSLPIPDRAKLDQQLRILNKKVYLVLGMALSMESGPKFLVSLDADNRLYQFEATLDLVVTGHELLLKTFFWPPVNIPKPVTIRISECQSVIYGEDVRKVLVGSMFSSLQLILSDIEDLIHAQSANEARIVDEDISVAVAQIDSVCAMAPSYNPGIVNSNIAVSVCERFFGKSFELFAIRGDGNCFYRCLATIVYWLYQNVDVSLQNTFMTDFSKVIEHFPEGTTMLTASDCHLNVRNFINSHLKSEFSASEFTDVVDGSCANKRKGDCCSAICNCPLFNRHPEFFDFDKTGFRAHLLHGILVEMDKNDLSHKEINDFITNINSMTKEYSGSTAMSMAFELLKKYCRCQLVSIRHENQAFSIRGDLHQMDCTFSAIIVFEEHECTNLNHYSILVPSNSGDICIPTTLALASLHKANDILEKMVKVGNEKMGLTKDEESEVFQP